LSFFSDFLGRLVKGASVQQWFRSKESRQLIFLLGCSRIKFICWYIYTNSRRKGNV